MIKFLAIMILSTSAFFSNAATENLVNNGDFSFGKKSWNFRLKNEIGKFVNEGPDGKTCYTLTGNGNQQKSIYIYNMSVNGKQLIDLKEGENYTMSFWVKTEKISGLFKNSLLHIINQGWSRSVTFSVPATCKWTKIVKTFKAPKQKIKTNTNYSLLFFIPKQFKGTFWITDITVTKGKPNIESLQKKQIDNKSRIQK